MNTTLLIAAVLLAAILLGGCGFKGTLRAPETGYQSVPGEPANAADEAL